MFTVAYVDQVSELGGAEHLLLTLLRGVSQSRISPILICTREGAFPNQARRLGIRTIIVPLPPLASVSRVVGTIKIPNPFAILLNGLNLIRSAVTMRSVLRTEGVDIVQTNSAFAHIYGGLAARLVRKPCIWYLHDLVEPRRMLGTVALAWRFLARVLATQVVADSEAAARCISDSCHATVIYAGINVGEVQVCNDHRGASLKKVLRLRNDAILVGYVGRISYVKGLDNLIRAAERIIDQNDRVHFLVLGEGLDGEADYKNHLVSMVSRAGLRDRWHWLGYDPEAAARMSELDLIVLPSRRECFGLVLLEAGLAGKAVIASRVGGIPEVIIHGETGVLVPPDDPEELTQGILHLIDNPSEAQKMGKRAQERITQLFSLPRYYEEFARLYDSLSPQTSC